MRGLGVHKHAVAGFQLSQTLGPERAGKRLKEVAAQWEAMRAGGRENIHVELATFSDQTIYEQFVDTLLFRADSLGANEQELQTLHTYLKYNVMRLKEPLQSFKVVANPYPSVNSVLSQLFYIIDEVQKRNGTVSRIHAHGVAEHYLLYKG